ncbi:CCRG-2 family RiPP [Prochlorococcus marinus]|uniref:CCRG-2 family RiPP n=1 Tax=Prochlorococcus marinus TaxID=1219 RepID=UPI0022B343FD|nr:CCRG-2 family RiPP [Prochlorococcus marinus]
MNNTELTLDQLAEVAGGGVFAKLDGFKQIIHPQFITGLHDSVHCFRGRKTRNQTNIIVPTDGDDI